MITEDRVTFEIAKLLRDKGFEQDTVSYPYYTDKGNLFTGDMNTPTQRCYNAASAPTIQMAMKWLREVHNIDITITPDYKENYTAMIFVNRELPFTEIGSFKTHKAACEAAIKYCLENLI